MYVKFNAKFRHPLTCSLLDLAIYYPDLRCVVKSQRDLYFRDEVSLCDVEGEQPFDAHYWFYKRVLFYCSEFKVSADVYLMDFARHFYNESHPRYVIVEEEGER